LQPVAGLCEAGLRFRTPYNCGQTSSIPRSPTPGRAKTGLAEASYIKTGLAEASYIKTGLAEASYIKTGLAEASYIKTGLAEASYRLQVPATILSYRAESPGNAYRG